MPPALPPDRHAPQPAAAPGLGMAAPTPRPGSFSPGWLDRSWRNAMDLLPLILLVLLALATGWLVKSMPKEELAKPAPPASEPDYYMRSFQVRDFSPQGLLQSELQGKFADHLPASDTIRAQQAQSYSRDSASGVETRSWADRAISDRQGHNAELFDNVKVVRTDPQPDAHGQPKAPMQFESNYLKIVNRSEHIRSDQPVRITQGNDVMTGSGLDYTGANKVIEVKGRVNAVIQPRRP